MKNYVLLVPFYMGSVLYPAAAPKEEQQQIIMRQNLERAKDKKEQAQYHEDIGDIVGEYLNKEVLLRSLLDLDTYQKVYTTPFKAHSTALASDGLSAIIGDDDSHDRIHIVVRNARGAWVTVHTEQFTSEVDAVAINAQGTCAIIGCQDGHFYILERTLKGWNRAYTDQHPEVVFAVALNKAGTCAIIGSDDGLLRIVERTQQFGWKTAYQKQYADKIGSALVDASGMRAIVGVHDGHAEILERTPQSQWRSVYEQQHGLGFPSLALATNGMRAVMGNGNGQIYILERNKDQVWEIVYKQKPEQENAQKTYSAALNADGTCALIGFQEGEVLILKFTQKGWKEDYAHNFEADINLAVLDATGLHALIASTDGFARILERTRKDAWSIRNTIQSAKSWIFFAGLSADGNCAILQDENQAIILERKPLPVPGYIDSLSINQLELLNAIDTHKKSLIILNEKQREVFKSLPKQLKEELLKRYRITPQESKVGQAHPKPQEKKKEE